MSQEHEVAILFADVVGSTELYELLGDDHARETVGQCLGIMKEATEENRGQVIKTIGDEVMATFTTVDDAMNAAAKMQHQISNNEELGADEKRVSIRVGCHYGPVTYENKDIFGSAVHTANRMTSQAKARQIVTTGSTVEMMGPEWRSVARQIDVATVKGKRDEVALFEVLWSPEEATSMLPTIGWDNDGRLKPTVLVLSFRGQTIEISDDHKHATLGRADENDVVIKGNLISRVHARIEKRRQKYILIDESTNGTFVQNVQGEEIFLRRDSTEIAGEGIIGLGRVAKPGTALAIHYQLVSE
ncbi:MAG: adenylate/guanylate cyclase domain-containing protein [Pseudomonadota bacterium]